MNFLAPWHVPALAAALALPPLVLLYFLKLKRRQIPIASTLLWKRAVHDLQVNSPFQRLRNNLLLILQLLILIAAIAAISEPVRPGKRGIDKAVVLLIDQSASMGAKEADGRTRLQMAKEEAHKIVNELGSSQRAMVIAFCDRARVMSAFTNDKPQLRAAIDAIEQTDGPSLLREAMELAEAHSTPIGEVREVGSSQYILLTDGRLCDSENVRVERGTMEIARIGEATENVGIVSLDVRRNYDRPEQISALINVRNFGTRPAKRDISLLVDGQIKNIQDLPELAPYEQPDRIHTAKFTKDPADNSQATATFEMMLDTAATIEVRLSGEDALAIDDRAFAVVTPPRSIKALLVSPGNRFLRIAIGAVLDSFDIWQPEEYEKASDDKLIEDGRCLYNVVVFDGHSTNRLPPGNYLFFAAAPLIPDVTLGDVVPAPVLLDWDDTHPVLRHVNVATMSLFSCHKPELPSDARTLIEATSGPVLSLLTRERHQYLICSFSLFDEDRTHVNTDWPYQEGLVMFMFNALRFLSGSSTIGQQPSVSPGQAFTVSVKPGTREITVRRPDGTTDKAAASASGLATYGRTNRVGFYYLETGISGEDARAVNLLDAAESLIASNSTLRVASGETVAVRGSDYVNRPLWPWILGVLGVILLVEWIVYNKRVFV